MIVKLLTEHHLEFLSLKRGCTGSSKSTLVKMPHCWKSHVAAHFTLHPHELLLSFFSSLGKSVIKINFLILSIKSKHMVWVHRRIVSMKWFFWGQKTKILELMDTVKINFTLEKLSVAFL